MTTKEKNTIKELFEKNDFNTKYKGTEKFCETKYFRLFQDLLENEDLLEKIKFANDYLKIPPLQSWICYYREANKIDEKTKLVSKTDFTKEDFEEEANKSDIKIGKLKQGLGACFGYLYQIVYPKYYSKLEYEAKQSWFNDSLSGIKTASYFVKK